MECYSLPDSYGYVVYENKKVLKKKFSEKYFSSDENFENPPNLKNVGNPPNLGFSKFMKI